MTFFSPPDPKHIFYIPYHLNINHFNFYPYHKFYSFFFCNPDRLWTSEINQKLQKLGKLKYANQSIYSSHHWWYNQHDTVKRTIFQKMHFSLVPRDSLSRRSLNHREFSVTLFFSGFVPFSSRYNKRILWWQWPELHLLEKHPALVK